MLADTIALLLRHPALLVLIVFGAAAVEYVFPPFWGDTLMLAGSFVAGLQPARIPLVFAAALAGSCAGAAGAWWVGRRFGKASVALLRRSPRARRLAEQAEQLFDRHGARVLVLNRFLPGVRAFLVPLAGVGNMTMRRTMAWSFVSNVLYCALVTLVGAVVAARTTDLAALQSGFATVSLWAAGFAAAVLVTVTTIALVRRPKAA